VCCATCCPQPALESHSPGAVHTHTEYDQLFKMKYILQRTLMDAGTSYAVCAAVHIDGLTWAQGIPSWPSKCLCCGAQIVLDGWGLCSDGTQRWAAPEAVTGKPFAPSPISLPLSHPQTCRPQAASATLCGVLHAIGAALSPSAALA
jgi:hypothetical protein